MFLIPPLLDPAFLAQIPAVSRALGVLRETDDATIADQLELVRIPAPSFDEGRRATAFAERCRSAGLVTIWQDEVGNVLATVPGGSASDGPQMELGGEGVPPPIVVAAHLDSVFPAETDLTVRRSGERYLVPGIGDNARGLAALLALGRALVGGGVQTLHPITLVATVGEEGIGDLRGVKHLFREGSSWRNAAAFIGVDGTGLRRVVNQAIGSRRLRVAFSGPGGHSWADWGRVNPIHTLGQVIAELSQLVSPQDSTSALTVGRIGGGTSINTIPSEAWLELDLRSEDNAALVALEARARGVIEKVTRESDEWRRAGTPDLRLRVEVVGDRPAGVTASSTALVRAASAATEFIGEVPELAASSTDANVPIALGIPAIALGAGGSSGGAHTIDEWYENGGGVKGLERLLLTILAVAGVARPGVD